MFWFIVICAIIVFIVWKVYTNQKTLHEAAEGSEPAIVENPVDKGNKPLHDAIRKGDTALVKSMLEKGVDVEARNHSGWSWTALMRAADGGFIEIVELLLDRGADVNAKDNSGHTALMNAVSSNNTDIIKLLLDRGADVNAKDDINNQTALINAAHKCSKEIVELLLDRGANIEAKSKLGWNALMEASYRIENVKLLLDRGADINAQDEDGRTALMYNAFFERPIDTIKLLLDRGADLNAKDKDGRTILDRTYTIRNPEMVPFVINALRRSKLNLNELAIKYGEDACNKIWNGEVWVGMSEEQLKESKGDCDDKSESSSKTIYKYGLHIGNRGSKKYDLEVTVKKGVVTAWKKN
jgi:ankyrin repeat protein